MRYHSIIDRDKYGKREGKRGWFHFGRDDRFELSYEISSNRVYRLCSIDFGRGSRSIKASIYIPFVIGLSVKVGGVLPRGKKRKVRLAYHGAAIWWSLWIDPWGDEKRWSKFRNGCFHLDDFFFGKSTCHRELLEHRSLAIPMPEKSYWGSVRLVRYTWKRPRWFSQTIIRAEIDVPEGVPHEGKGENSWDCGVDATFGMTTGPVRDIPDAVGKFVASVLRDRVKYGGWNDYHWSKPVV